jgi:hypothetical protein
MSHHECECDVIKMDREWGLNKYVNFVNRGIKKLVLKKDKKSKY